MDVDFRCFPRRPETGFLAASRVPEESIIRGRDRVFAPRCGAGFELTPTPFAYIATLQKTHNLKSTDCNLYSITEHANENGKIQKTHRETISPSLTPRSGMLWRALEV